jgi:hypothetical protein
MRSFGNGASFANDYKPALMLDAMPLAKFTSTLFFSSWLEGADPKGMPTRLMSDGPDETMSNTAHQVTTRWPDIKPIVRRVRVINHAEMASLLFEFDPGGYGLAVVMVMTVGEVQYFNVRFLPFSRLVDVAQVNKDGVLEVMLPDIDIVKLNVTLSSSTLAEPLYRTHKTEATFANLDQAEEKAILSDLEFQAAPLLAKVAQQVLQSTGAWPLPVKVSAQPMALGAPGDEWPFWAQQIAGGFIGASAVIGILTTRRPAAFRGYGAMLSIGFGGIGGLVSNYQNGITPRRGGNIEGRPPDPPDRNIN